MESGQFERLARVFSAILPPLVSGCVATPDTIDARQFTEDLCSESGPQVLDAVEPAEAVDYLELREVEDYSWGGETPEWGQLQIRDSSGSRCGGASDVAACEAAFEALSLESDLPRGGWDIPVVRSLVFTRGDTVGKVGSLDALRGFLGPIDATGDAALLAILEGHQLLCEEGNNVGRTDQGYVLHTRSGGGCGEGDDIEHHVVLVRPDGSLEVQQTVLIERGDPGCAVGRLPAGLRPRPAMCGLAHPVGEFLAEVAHLEAAAVTAFQQFAQEMALHGAPRRMTRAAMRSRRDEVRHARVMNGLARRYGGAPVAARVEPWTPRSLTEVACDNAAEGCIRETFGALVAHAQARQARDPVVRRALFGIARDETRHAALSWEFAGWVRRRLSGAQRRRVAARTRDALERMEHDATRAYDSAVHEVTGLPRPERARAMFGQLREALLREALA